MSLSISDIYTKLATSAAGGVSAYARPSAAGANTEAQQKDSVQLSSSGRLRMSLGSLILPTEENVRALSASLSNDLRNLFSQQGISTQPPVEFSIDANGDIQVKGERPDKEQILNALNTNEKVKEQLRTTLAISSHAAAIADSLQFQKEYMASSNPESVVAKYSYLFGSQRRPHEVSLTFNGNGVNIMQNGTKWLSA